MKSAALHHAKDRTDDIPITGRTTRPVRLAYFVSHPIQYQAELLRRIAADPAIDLTVFFCSDFSIRAYQDAGFGRDITWDVPLTQGYRHIFLPRWHDNSNPKPFAPIAHGIFRALRRGVDGKAFDALWTHGYSFVNALHAILAARVLGLPVLLRAEPWLGDRSRSALKQSLKNLFFYMLRPNIAAVLPIGTRNEAYWAHHFGSRFPAFLMPYAVDNSFFAHGTQNAKETRSDLRRELDLEEGRPVILFASKLQHRKHCDHLLEAYLMLNIEPAPYLVIVGDGEEMSSLRARVHASGHNAVRFTGFRNQQELPRFFDLASVFVLPSKHEAWGLIVNEAMAAGLPVVVSDDVGCATDLVHDGENGFVYPFGDVPALCDALRNVLQPGEAARMGLASQQRIAHWSYAEDIAGLKAALHATTRLPILESSVSAQQEEHAAAAL